MTVLDRYVERNISLIREQLQFLVDETPTRLTLTCLIILAGGYFVEWWIAFVAILFMVLDDIVLLRGAKSVLADCKVPCYIAVNISNTLCSVIYSGYFTYIALYSTDNASLMFSALVLMASFIQFVAARAADPLHGMLSVAPIMVGISVILGNEILLVETTFISRVLLFITLFGAISYVSYLFVTNSILRATLQKERNRATEANRTKSRFLAAMSHEIRTPLNGIYGTAQILLQTSNPNQRKARTKLLVDAASGLKAIVDDIIEYSRIEEGKLALRAEDTDVRAFIRQRCDLFQANAEIKGLLMDLTFGTNLPQMAHFDAIRAGQVLNNLMSNAVKYTQKGKISTHVSYHEALAGGGVVEIAVTDTGPGLTREEQQEVFASYSQIDRLMNHAVGGAGLGLAIALDIARLMEGDIRLESRLGHGSSFIFTFRVDATKTVHTYPVSNMKISAAPIPYFEGLRVLVVDDVDINRIVVRGFLEPLGTTLFEANNGQSALEILSDEQVDIVLLDQQMPVMSGHEMLRLMRSAPEPLRSTPVIAITAGTLDNERLEFMSLGLDGFLAKPIERTNLLAAMSSALEKRGMLIAGIAS